MFFSVAVAEKISIYISDWLIDARTLIVVTVASALWTRY